MKPSRRTPKKKNNPAIDRLVREGQLRPAKGDLSEWLERRGPLTGPITDAGTRALQEQRGERG